jgi:hypothetical protein
MALKSAVVVTQGAIFLFLSFKSSSFFKQLKISLFLIIFSVAPCSYKKDGVSFQLLIVMKKGKARNNPK